MGITLLKGNLIYTTSPQRLECIPGGYLAADGNTILGVFHELPPEYAGMPVTDYGDRLIVPGLSDLHVHAPQFVYMGLGLDMQLMQWLETYAFPVESRFSDLAYARLYYGAFSKALVAHGTTRAVVFGTIHAPAAEILMECMQQNRLAGFAGKINMDTLCPDFLREECAQSLEETEQWILRTRDKFPLVKPAITPRFIPTCSTELLEGLGQLAKKYGVPIHSHLSEDLGEMAVVRQRYPAFEHDSAVYDSFGLFGERTVMAHFVYPSESELELTRQRGVTIAHCPQSNVNVAAGLPPIRKMLEMGIPVGLGSDIAGGHSPSIFRAMSDAMMVSKMRWLQSDKQDAFLTVPEVFYLGTKGGGSFFGKVGSFEPGYLLDALVLDDAPLHVCASDYTLEQRLERVIHLSDDRHVKARYVDGVLS